MKIENILDKTFIVGHRGYSSKYPENTFLSFKKALEIVDFIEFDVQFTKDGIAIILHDDTLNRTSDIESFKEFDNSSYKIEDFNYKELLKLNFNYMNKEEKEKLPTLKEFLEFAKNNGLFFNLEIKDLKDTKFHNSCALEVLKLVKEYECEDLVLISSFNHFYLKQIRKKNKNITLAALVDEDKQIDLEFLKKYKINGCNMSDEMISDEYIKIFHENGIFVGVYTVNEKKRKEKLKSMGVNFIFTDELE